VSKVGILAAAAGLAAAVLVSAFVTLAYPALFPAALAEPSFDLDAAEGKATLDSRIVLEVRGNLSLDEVREALSVTPPVDLDDSDLTVEHVAPFPWHERFSWAKTRVTINDGGARLFQPETAYTIAIKDQQLDFDTIVLPRVVGSRLTPPADEALGQVPTSAAVVLRFNQELDWQDEWLTVTPPAPVTATTRRLADGGTEVRLQPAERWDNSTKYDIAIPEGVTDVDGHEGEEPFSLAFITLPGPTVLEAAPSGDHLSPASTVRVEFDQDMDRASVEDAFAIKPSVKGTFEWEGNRAFVWTAERLDYSTSYSVSVNGESGAGDPLAAPRKWSFATHDPPVTLAIEGSAKSPTTLTARVSGGTGDYAYAWSTGATSEAIDVDLWFEESETYSVSVTSGDQSASDALLVRGPPSPCPNAYWRIVSEELCYLEESLPGPVDVFVARIDLNDADVQLISEPAAGTLGGTRTVGEAAQASGAVVSVNGDFFNVDGTPHLPGGPIISAGSYVHAPRSADVMLAVDGARASWAGPADALDVFAVPPNGDALPVSAVNRTPGSGELSLFNSYYGSTLSLGVDGCYAVFAPADNGATAPRAHACGGINGVSLRAGEFVLAGRGAAAAWLQAHAGAPISFTTSFALPDVRFAVGGSHVLIRDGLPTDAAALAGARHPRTAIGVDGEGHLYLVVVDGRSASSVGMTLPELQRYLAGFKLRNAINLDGGGSSTLVLEGAVMNVPSDGHQRRVASFVGVRLTPGVCWHRFVRCP
jgi:hypothetical protein